MKVYRYNPVTDNREEIFNIMKGTYTGKDMGERSITAIIEFPSRIDFRIGDYIEYDIANLLRATGVEGGHGLEKFYIYTMPTVKKIAKRMSHGKAFQHTVTFYPCQYELATVKMRDVLQEAASGVIYTGYDEFSFYGGANTLMKRIMAVLNERFPNTGIAGKDYWSYQIADSINEDVNTALEKFQFDFSDSSVMDALLKLNDAEGINTKFFINERMIYVGYKRPYITGVDANNIQRSVPFEFMYGKTSHLPGSTNYGNLFTLTKASGTNSPITRLYAYGSDRNLHRFYCSDRIKTGRYVNKLMLPSFGNDGRTDYIDSPEGIAKFGIREGTKTFDNIYPSLRFFYYGNLRDVKYCIKLMGCGLEKDDDGVYDKGIVVSKSVLSSDQIERLANEYKTATDKIDKEFAPQSDFTFTVTINGQSVNLSYGQTTVLLSVGKVIVRKSSEDTHKLYQYPIARIQCYKVIDAQIPKRDEQGNIIYDSNNNPVTVGLNKLVECQPPVDLAVFCHATGKVVKCVLYADKNGKTSIQRQSEADGKIPVDEAGNPITGSCFAVHDSGFTCGHTHYHIDHPDFPKMYCDERSAWFIDSDTISIYTSGNNKTVDTNKEIYRNQVSIHQINYTDDHWITDVYEFKDYNQQTFYRQGYSAYCWPRVNKYYNNSQSDNIEVNAVVDVGPVYIEDTDLNMAEGQRQKTFDVYMRDMGFKINEQTWFGDRVFLFDTCHINFIDGKLAGYSFEMPNESDQETLGSIYVPALKPDGTENEEFFDMADNPAQARAAFNDGAFWRLVVKRTETEVGRYYVPNTLLNASKGDHVVFLDIFMPDIYIRVAEQRLEKEARKYLDANDDGDIQYSFDIDQVRPNEQPIFVLQMREGAVMRVVDDDLDVGTINNEKKIFEHKNGIVSVESMHKYDINTVTNYKVVVRTREEIEGTKTKGGPIVYDEVSNEYYILFNTLREDANKEMYYDDGLTVFWEKSAISFKMNADNILGIEHVGSGSTVALHKLRFKNVDFLKRYENTFSWEWKVEYCYKQTIITPQIDQSVLPSGVRRYCAANSLIEFKPSKYYEVLIDTIEPDLAVSENNIPSFALVNGLGDGQTIFVPEYTAKDVTPNGVTYKSVLYKFTLNEDFNDSKDYYPAILFQSDGLTEAVHVRLMSIVERDDEHLGNLNYVDLSIDTVTIEFNDNTREKGVSLQDGMEPERLTPNPTGMIYKISATVKEESRASAWAQLMSRVADNELAEEKNLMFYQNVVNTARKHYIELLNLRNKIFDPDGTCNETFLQIMMLQVGADSMNYQLKYTHYSMNGKVSNCGIEKGSTISTDSGGNKYYDKFFIENAAEVLDHYVFTDGAPGGRWYPVERNWDKPLSSVLDTDGVTLLWPTYFVALKASVNDPTDCHWVCDTVQHKVNDENNYYYFNWGILSPDENGHYAITETRGNAYMYGDNLICGRISDMSKKSYFDLTHGDFVLSQDGPDPTTGEYHEGLTYINGKLTIYGIPTTSDISAIMTRIMGLDDKISDLENPHTNLWPIDEEKHLVLEDKEIYLLGYILADHFYRGEIFTGTVEIKDYTPNEVYGQENGYTYISLYVKYADRAEEEQTFWYDYGGGEFVTIREDGKRRFNINIDSIIEDIERDGENTVSRIKEIMVYIEPHLSESTKVSLTLYQGMIVSGNKSGVYSLAYKHLADALQGTTEIAGGLTMTNLLLLKNELGRIVAGMSGLTEGRENVLMWGGATYAEALYASLKNYLKSATGGLIPTLFKKDGTGKVGCFYVVDASTVEVENVNKTGKIQFSLTNGITLFTRLTSSDTYNPVMSFAMDGSGFLANNKIYWDSNGNVTMNDVTANNGTFRGIMQASKFAYGVQVITTSRATIQDDASFVINKYTGQIRVVLELPINPVDGQTITFASYNNVGLKFVVNETYTNHKIMYQGAGVDGATEWFMDTDHSITLIFHDGFWYDVN